MNNFFRITLVAVLVSAFVVCVGCKRTDDLSSISSQQAASTKEQSDTPSAAKPAAQPSASAASAKSDDQKDKAGQAPAEPEAKTKAKEATATEKPAATSDKAQTASSEKKAVDGQPSTKPTKGGVVTIPQTEHVRVDIPKGLQKLLNEDSRMQPWVNKVMKVANSCYASQRESSEKAKGVIVVEVTMHPNARPDAEIKSLPPPLSGMVACSTSGLMGTRMPLFTGPEGEKFTIRLEFKR